MYMHLYYISGEKYALYFHNLLSENVDDLPFISFYEDFSVSLENRWNCFVPLLWWLLWTLLSLLGHLVAYCLSHCFIC